MKIGFLFSTSISGQIPVLMGRVLEAFNATERVLNKLQEAQIKSQACRV